MSFDVHRVGDHAVAVSGEFDAEASWFVERCLYPVLRTGGAVTVDLSRVTLLDQGGVKAIVWAAALLRGSGRLVLYHPPPRLVVVLESAGLIPPPRTLPLTIEYDGVRGIDGPGAVHRLAAAIGRTADNLNRSAALVREGEAMVGAARAIVAESRILRRCRITTTGDPARHVRRSRTDPTT